MIHVQYAMFFEMTYSVIIFVRLLVLIIFGDVLRRFNEQSVVRDVIERNLADASRCSVLPTHRCRIGYRSNRRTDNCCHSFMLQAMSTEEKARYGQRLFQFVCLFVCYVMTGVCYVIQRVCYVTTFPILKRQVTVAHRGVSRDRFSRIRVEIKVKVSENGGQVNR